MTTLIHHPGARNLDDEYFRVIKDLGNAAIHPNDGNVERQHGFEAALLRQVGALFAELLDVIYEQPEKRKQRLGTLRKAAETITKTPANSDSA